MSLGLGDGVVAEMEDRGGKHGRSLALDDAFDQMIQRAHAARGDDGDADRLADGSGEWQVEARPRAVTPRAARTYSKLRPRKNSARTTPTRATQENSSRMPSKIQKFGSITAAMMINR